MKVIRVGSMANVLEIDGTYGGDDSTSLAGLDGEFTSQVVSGVRFAPLAIRPIIYTTIPSNVWNPSISRLYPNEHQCASRALLMCSGSEIVQPLPRVPSPDERFNAAAMLPKSIWLEILSYTHRRCKFHSPKSDNHFTKVNHDEQIACADFVSTFFYLLLHRVCTGAK